MFGHPGKKLMFMGCEFAQDTEWNHDHQLCPGICSIGRHTPASSGWCATSTGSIARCRRCTSSIAMPAASNGWSPTIPTTACSPGCARAETRERCLVVVNFTPQVLRDYRVRVPFAGTWREVLNTDAAIYGGSNVGNAGPYPPL